MMRPQSWWVFALLSFAVSAHPMGNFSVSHYSKLTLAPGGAELKYVLDFAEIPALDLLQQWQLDGQDRAAVQKKASEKAVDWLEELVITSGGARLRPVLQGVHTTLSDGAGGMLVMRVEMQARLPRKVQDVTIEDRNYANRAGWKEIVVEARDGVSVATSTGASVEDLSRGLTVYPSDPAITPPQSLRAEVRWTVPPPMTTVTEKRPVVTPAPAPALPAVAPAPKSFASAQPVAPGSVVQGDYLSRMIRDRQFGFGAILLGLLVAFGLGGMHAMSPGHGKTIVAAYLVGTRGTLKHALLLGLIVTFTHTVSVFLLGVGVLFFQQYVVPERVIPWLGAVSGISILGMGAYLLVVRWRALSGHGHAGHHHHHAGAGAGAHHHGDGRMHSHAMPSKITAGSLIALGASGGLVPCPSALILLLSAIAVGRTGLGLLLLGGFSTGLAVVLMAIGGLVIYGRQLLPASLQPSRYPILHFVPVASAVVVMVLGALMTLSAATSGRIL